MRARKRGLILVVATRAPGGIDTVLQGYRDTGFAERHNMRFLSTHRPGSLGMRLFCALSAFFQAAILMVRGRVGLLHCHVAAFGSFYRKSVYAELARLFGVPVIWHIHASELGRFLDEQGRVERLWTRRQFARAAKTLALSKRMADRLAEVAPRERIAIIPNAVRIPPSRIPARRDDNGPVILSLGLVGPRKGSFDLIVALALLGSAHPQARLILAGNGDLDAARELAASMGVAERVELPGWVDGDGRQRLFDCATIYALPSHGEGLPMSLLEAMAQGLPVVTTAVGGIPDLVSHRRTGLVVPPGDVVGLAAALSALLGDPAQRATLGQAGRDHVARHFSFAAIMPRLEAVYAEAMRLRSPVGVASARLPMTELSRRLHAFPAGTRVYAIGDIHGCDQLLAEIHRQIDAREAQNPAEKVIEIVLGDVIDRGPDSCGAVERLLRRREAGRDLRVLTGNHEAMMLEGLRDPAQFPRWLRQGGLETLQSYGVAPPESPDDATDLETCIDRFRTAMPEAHRRFFAGLEHAIDLAGFAFVHAGLRPGIAFETQRPDDMIWIREPFLSHEGPLDRFVVHGHTPGDRVDLRPHRIDLDTGAFHSGRLSCLMIERCRMSLTDSRSGWTDLI